VELKLAAAAGAIRALVNNRVDKELIRPVIVSASAGGLDLPRCEREPRSGRPVSRCPPHHNDA